MIIAKQCYEEMINNVARSIEGRVELYHGSTLVDTFTHDGALKEYVIERIGDNNKFFGYGICQKLTVKLRDTKRKIMIEKGQGLEVVVGVGCEYLYTNPIFFVDDVSRNENTNDITVVAYDALYRATGHKVSEVPIQAPYNIYGFVNACASVLGMPIALETSRNLLDLRECAYYNCYLQPDGNSILSEINQGYYASINTTSLNDKLMASLGETFTFSVGGNPGGREISIVIHGARSNGATYQEVSTTGSAISVTVDNDFISISSLELRFNRVGSPMTDKTSVIAYAQFEKGASASVYDPFPTAFSTYYPDGANFDGTETIREALDDVAEATQTIYYMNNNWELTFKKLDTINDPVLYIDKSKYFTLTSKSYVNLERIVSATELGDNVSADTGLGGYTQYIKDNAFYENRDDIAYLLDTAIKNIGGLVSTPFDLKWRGNFLLELGDKISIVTKNNRIIVGYVLNDTITYNGGLVEQTSWDYTNDAEGDDSTPTTAGEAIKQTFARVDKANKQITLLASETSDLTEQVSKLQVNTDGITATVTQVQNNVETSLNAMGDNINVLTEKLSTTMTSDSLSIAIQQEIATNGVSNVVTQTGFTFNEEGLTIDKAGTEMSTTITEDGMTVYRDDAGVLIADNTGVKAENLHATTFLIIGANSRFEDYINENGEARTACFWIGG